METPTLRVLDIVPGTSVDGPGLRTSIYFAGCHHHCEGCHNPQSWDMAGGREMTIDEIVSIIEENGFNVTFSGGDPIYQLEPLITLAETLKSLGYNIWCYTGFDFGQLLEIETIQSLLCNIDVIVDGPFIMPLRDISLRFRGSSNQRIIDVAKSTNGNITLWQDGF